MAIPIGDAVLEIGGDTTKLKKSLESIGKQMQKTGRNLTMKLTAPLAAFAGLSLKTAADFSKAMAKVNAVTGATEEQFAELNDTAKELGRTTQFTATQVAKAMSFMGMAGMDANEILSSIPHTLNLAAAGAIDLASASDIVTNVMAGFGMETRQLEGAVDVLAKAFTSSNTDLLQLGEAMKFAGPIAKGFGMSFEETSAILGLFGNAGIQASMAGTTLRGALVRLDKKSQELGLSIWDTAGKLIPMADILTQLEEQGVNTSEMMELFGLRAGPGMVAVLSQGIDSLKEFTAELENAGGTAERIAETQMEGLHGTLIRLKSAFEGLQLAVAEEITPAFEGLTRALTDVFRGFADLPGPIKTTAVALGALAAIVGPLIWMTGTLITNFAIIKGSIIGVGIASVATTAILKVMIGVGVGLAGAITAIAIAVAALVAGLTLVILGLKELSKNAKIRKTELEVEAKRVKALTGEYRAYADALKEVEMMGAELNEEQREYLALVDLMERATVEHARAVEGLDNDYMAILKTLRKHGAALDEDTLKWLALAEVMDQAPVFWDRLTEAESTASAELDIYMGLMGGLEDSIRDVAEASELYFRHIGPLNQLIGTIPGGFGEAAPVPQYAHGGPILGPTALTSLATGQTYAIAGEAGPESVVPGGGGSFRTANIYLMIDGRVLARAMGQPLVDEIRLKTGTGF